MRIYQESTLKQYCQDVMKAAGIDDKCAKDVAEALVDADLTGVATHGVSRLAIYLQRVKAGAVSRNNQIRILRESPSALAIDAGNTLGAPSAKFAMEHCVEKARESGCCFATVRNSNHFGAAAFYAKIASAQGMIGFVCTNLTGKIAPYGAAEPYAGTNPIAIAVPGADAPVVLDMTPSVVALGKLILAEKLGQSIPEGWALDKDGNPTTDPAAGRAGSLVPLGGPKGSGMAIMVDILCGVLSGSGFGPHLNDLYSDLKHPQGVGHFLGAIDIAHFINPETFLAGMEQMCGEIKGLRRASGTEEIFLPGERSARKKAAQQDAGISLPDAVVEELESLGVPYGLKLMPKE